jgi:hypothetical protein
MTLVVGRVDGPRVAIASDSLLTQNEWPFPFQEGVVKSCMLPGNICVSFANSEVTAERAFASFWKHYPNGTGFGEAIGFFEESSRETGNDYLVAFTNPARLIKITDGKRMSSLSKTQWIGDSAAYNRFREYQSGRRKPQQGRALNVAYFADEVAKSPASDLFSTMRNLVIDPTVPSVGGFVSVISNRDNGFRFSVYCDMLFDWPAMHEEYEFALTDKVSLQVSGENANFSIAQVSPGFMNMNFVGFYFVKARKLFFFFGENFGLPTRCKVFQDVAPTAIHEILNSFLDTDFRWLVTITSPQSAGPYTANVPGIKSPGVRLAFMCEANTFPKTG